MVLQGGARIVRKLPERAQVLPLRAQLAVRYIIQTAVLMLVIPVRYVNLLRTTLNIPVLQRTPNVISVAELLIQQA
jgi:hypothetical protein